MKRSLLYEELSEMWSEMYIGLYDVDLSLPSSAGSPYGLYGLYRAPVPVQGCTVDLHFSETFLIISRTEPNMIKKYIGLHVKYVILIRF